MTLAPPAVHRHSSALILLLLAPLALLGQAGKATKPRSPSLVPDKGKFVILIDGQPAGSEEFEISSAGNEWQAQGTTHITSPGGAASQVKGTLRLAADGSPHRYEWSTQGEKKASAIVTFQGPVASVTLLLQNSQPFEQIFSFDSPRVVILDNNLYHQYALLARIYDWDARGSQTFPVLIPQEMTPGSIAVESIGPQLVEGKTLELLRVRTSDLEIDLYLDSSRRLIQLLVPSAKALIRRE